MAKFVYKMQNVLNIKEKLETQAKSDFSAANQQLRMQQDKLSTLMTRKRMYEIQAKALMQGSLNIQEIQANKQAIVTMENAIRRQTIVVQKAEKEVEIARAKLKDLMIERKTHEVLRDKAFEDFKEEIKSEESKEVDELVSYTFHIDKE